MKVPIANLRPVLIMLYSFLTATNSFGKDFTLDDLKQAASPNFTLQQFIGTTYYDVVHNFISDAMEKEGSVRGGSNEDKLKNGGGVSVELAPNIFNIHINFPKSEMGGRSYGWTSGAVGDWSDSMYLDNLGKAVAAEEKAEMANFYRSIVLILGNSDSSMLPNLKTKSIRVATNFLAIYTAEQYRRIQKKTTRWDDALLQVTLLGAFHSGQSKFKMFYAGDFTDIVREKGSGVYSNGNEGVFFSNAKREQANMESYHQFSGKTPDQKGATRSGINLTRKDFEKLGAEITAYFETNGSQTLAQIKKIIGYNPSQLNSKAKPNIIAAIASYFAEGKAKAEESKVLADAISAFMMETHRHANAISGVITENIRREDAKIPGRLCMKYYSR